MYQKQLTSVDHAVITVAYICTHLKVFTSSIVSVHTQCKNGLVLGAEMKYIVIYLKKNNLFFNKDAGEKLTCSSYLITLNATQDKN